MEAIAGVFDSRADAERGVYGLRSAGIANDRIVFLTGNQALPYGRWGLSL